MAKIRPFELFGERYEAWFERHAGLYRLELEAVSRLIPDPGLGLEVGVGSGRFAHPLKVAFGIEPCKTMAQKARRLGIRVALGVAEELPVKGRIFDHVLMVTTICFVDDIRKSLIEAKRILRPKGSLVIGLVDRDSFLGREYLKKKDRNVFYREATFFSATEVCGLLTSCGFRDIKAIQTIMPDDPGLVRIEEGWGDGGFVVFRGDKP